MPLPTTAPLRLARATPDDAEALAALAERTFRDTYAPLCAPADVEAYIEFHFGAERQRRELADPAMLTLLGWAGGGDPVAYAQLRFGVAGNGVTGRAPVEVARFYVDHPLHGTGAAQALMREALSAAAARGADVAWLGVWERNPRAIGFYTRQGFAPVGRQTFLMGSDLQHDHVLARSLA